MADMAAILKIYFSLHFLSRKLTPDLVGSIRVTCRSKIAKICWLEIQDGHHGGHFENLFFASSPKPKSQLTWNLVGSIRVTYRSKMATIIPIENPGWPPWRPSWKSICHFFSWTERLISSPEHEVVRRPSCGVNNCFKSLLLLHLCANRLDTW